MTNKTILAIDQGTTSSRAILFSADGTIISTRQKELELFYPHNGWVEQNPLDIWNDTLLACRSVMESAPDHAANIAAIGITNQRETTIVWDRKTGEPVYNAIVWQDRRTSKLCQDLKNSGHEDMVRAKTGLLLDPYFSGTKLAWILDNVDGARTRADAGDLAFGTVDCYLLWKFTGGAVHATDITNASRTMLYNIVDQDWDDALLKLLNIPRSMLPDVRDNVADFGQTKAEFLGRSITIGGIAGDQQAAIIGQACFAEGMVKSTYGTGCFALMNIGKNFRESKNRLLTTPAYRFNGDITYAVEGSIFVSGAAVQWLRDGLGLFRHAADSEKLATSVADTNGVYLVPAFTGMGAPYWDADARGFICGLTRDATAAHITRAALEAQAYQTRDLIAAMEGDAGKKIETIRADGGLVANQFVCQFLSDILNCPVDVPRVTETTALGAAYLAGLHAGIYNGLDDIANAWECAHHYDPKMDADKRDALYAGWVKAVARTLV